MPTDTRPIGIFDSGLGGLTAVRALDSFLPGENIVYFGDTARVPYGSRSCEIIFKYLRQDIAFLQTFDIKALVVACGTASTVGLSPLRDAYPFPIFDVVEPAAGAAARATRNGRVGLIATSAAVSSGAYEDALLSVMPSAAVFAQACPLLAPLVENGRGQRGDAVAEILVREYLQPLLDVGIDTLILGCTHYPLLSDVIRDIAGDSVTLIDSGEAVAHATADRLHSDGLTRETNTPGTRRYFVSDGPEGFAKNAALFLGHVLEGPMQKVDIEDYA